MDDSYDDGGFDFDDYSMSPSLSRAFHDNLDELFHCSHSSPVNNARGTILPLDNDAEIRRNFYYPTGYAPDFRLTEEGLGEENLSSFDSFDHPVTGFQLDADTQSAGSIPAGLHLTLASDTASSYPSHANPTDQRWCRDASNRCGRLSSSSSSMQRMSGRRARMDSCLRRGEQRRMANVRERRRMKTINDAFEGLRSRIPFKMQWSTPSSTSLPTSSSALLPTSSSASLSTSSSSSSSCSAAARKLSKVDTLRLAIRYIHHLTDLVTRCQDDEAISSSGSSPSNFAGCSSRGRIGSDSDVCRRQEQRRVFIRYHRRWRLQRSSTGRQAYTHIF